MRFLYSTSYTIPTSKSLSVGTPNMVACELVIDLRSLYAGTRIFVARLASSLGASVVLHAKIDREGQREREAPEQTAEILARSTGVSCRTMLEQ